MLDWDEIDAAPALKSSEWIPRREALALGPVTASSLVAADGSIPRLNRILLADSASMLVGAMAGTSPVTSYIESAAGVSVGGRTGLTSVFVGLFFLGTLFFAPMVQAIPATAPALILVGALMMER